MSLGDYFDVPDAVVGEPATTYDRWCIIGFRELSIAGSSSGYFDRSMLFDATSKPFPMVENFVALDNTGAR